MSGVAQLRPTVADAMAKAEAVNERVSSHEDICAVRYGQISDILVELKSDIKDQHKLLWGVLLGVAGFVAAVLVAIVLHALKLT